MISGWTISAVPYGAHISVAEMACAARLRSRPPGNFHSLRKRVKEVWYQTRILQCLNSAVMCALADAAKTLGQGLGDLHNLAFFRTRLEAEEVSRDDESTVLLGLICQREGELEQIALDLGARFFAEKPLSFERRLLRYAREWPTRPA